MICDKSPLTHVNMAQYATTSKVVVTRLLVVSLFLLTMPWVNVSANKDSTPYVEINASPLQSYYDIYDNLTMQQSIRFEADAYDTDSNSLYRIKISLYEEYEIYGELNKKISSTYSSQHVSISIDNLYDEWVNGSNYTFFAELFEQKSGEDDFTSISNSSFSFGVGETPKIEPDPTLTNVEITCNEDWQITQNETRLEHRDQTFILECIAQNNNAVRVVPAYNLTQHQDTGIEFEINLENPLIMGNGSTTNFTLEPSDWNLSMIIPNGSVLVQINISAEGWQSNETNFEINYTIVQEIPDPPIEPVMILGCMDTMATNFNPNATADDDSCEYPPPIPQPIPPSCPMCNFTYQIPSLVSVDTPATFSANATLTDGWDYYGGATISWGFAGIIVNGAEVEHTYTSVPTDGTTTVTICVQFISGPENCQEEMITVNLSLAGYISHSSQLEPLSTDTIGGFHFTIEAWGGLAPYYYEWQFGDGTTSTNQSFVHEFIETGMHNVSLKVQDARGNTINLGSQVEIIDDADNGEDSTNINEIQDLPVGPDPFGMIFTGGGAIFLSSLIYSNGKKKRNQILKKGQLLAQQSSSSVEDSYWNDSTK